MVHSRVLLIALPVLVLFLATSSPATTTSWITDYPQRIIQSELIAINSSLTTAATSCPCPIIVSLAQWCDIGRSDVLEFIHVDHQLVPPRKSFIANLQISR